jgi:tRNA modification GTPase
MPDTTIASIATPHGFGGIGIIRLSGACAIEIADCLFTPKRKLKLTDCATYTMLYGQIHSGATHLADGICLLFRAPGSYTGEDVAELQCPGGPVVLHQVLQAAFCAGASPAQPGEFTKRAFLNGKLDLSQAEAVMQLISAKTAVGSAAANANLQGAVQNFAHTAATELTAQAAQLSAFADYPEEALEPISYDRLRASIVAMIMRLETVREKSRGANLFYNGANAVILGKPNVGKSTFMNALLGFNRAIVTDIPGTTRDTVTESVQLGSLLLNLTDTAGVRATDDPIEQMGVARSRKAIDTADIVFLILDVSAPLTNEDFDLLAFVPPVKTILLCNKADRTAQWQQAALPAAFETVFSISAVGKLPLNELEAACFAIGGAVPNAPGEALLLNARQTDCLQKALSALEKLLAELDAAAPPDMLTFLIEEALEALFSLTGEHVTTAVVDAIFSQFCVGK